MEKIEFFEIDEADLLGSAATEEDFFGDSNKEKENPMTHLTPNQTVRAYCVECLGLPQFNRSEIENCRGDTCVNGCAFFPYRLGKRIPVKIFRKFCVECMNGQEGLIPECPATKCKIYRYRFGKNPTRAGQGRSAEAMKSVRESGKNRQNTTIRQQSVSSQGAG